MDKRLCELASSLVNYSVAVKPGNKVLINIGGASGFPLVRQIIKEVYKAGGEPYVIIGDDSITREIMLGANKEQLEFMKEFESFRMREMDCYIGIMAGENNSALSDVPSEKSGLYTKHYASPVTRLRTSTTRWVSLRYPTSSMAQAARTSLESFEDFYFNVCNFDYKKMSAAMEPLVELMNRTDKVRITGPGTDVSFSIKGVPAIKCDGRYNVPDGEVFTAPVKTSVNGTITYNIPSMQRGFTFEDVKFTFEDGKIIDATANNTELLNDILNTDSGARYIGEFALGVHPHIDTPMNNILFDEKIKGSFHFTPGNAYEDEADNLNRSAVHWDLVAVQTKEYGGGEIYFDDILVRKDGIFVLPELEGLNPDSWA